LGMEKPKSSQEKSQGNKNIQSEELPPQSSIDISTPQEEIARNTRTKVEALTGVTLTLSQDAPGVPDYVSYRHSLAQSLNTLRAGGEDGREKAREVLKLVQTLPEYGDAKEFHVAKRDLFIEQRVTERREARRLQYMEQQEAWRLKRIEKMKEIVKELPLEYISIPEDDETPHSLKGAVLLKVEGTDSAFLVGDDLQNRGSSYVLTGDMHKDQKEFMYLLCGCGSCSWSSRIEEEKFIERVNSIASAHGIENIISRYWLDKDVKEESYKELRRRFKEISEPNKSEEYWKSKGISFERKNFSSFEGQVYARMPIRISDRGEAKEEKST
jgi:hypothetical protein